MFKAGDLDSIKLVSADNIALPHDVEAAIERAVQQGSGDWGVTLTDGVILNLTQQLRDALTGAAAAGENFRLLKGAQMELGRVKKQRDELRQERDFLLGDNENLEDQIDKLLQTVADSKQVDSDE